MCTGDLNACINLLPNFLHSTLYFMRLSRGLCQRISFSSGSGQGSGGTNRRWASSLGRLHGSLVKATAPVRWLSTGLSTSSLRTGNYSFLLIMPSCYYELWGIHTILVFLHPLCFLVIVCLLNSTEFEYAKYFLPETYRYIVDMSTL